MPNLSSTHQILFAAYISDKPVFLISSFFPHIVLFFNVILSSASKKCLLFMVHIRSQKVICFNVSVLDCIMSSWFLNRAIRNGVKR